MILQHILVDRAKITSPKKEDHMNLSAILSAYLAFLSGKGSFRFGKYTITLQNTGTNATKFSYSTALGAIEATYLLSGKVLPATEVIGSTSVTISLT
jgi:hypothetical protein